MKGNWKVASVAVLMLITTSVLAQTSWKGTSSTAWATAANWSAGVPTASLDAVIGDTNFTGANQPNISSTAVCKSLTLGTGTKASTLTVSQPLTVSGNITIGPNGKISHTASRTSRPIILTGNWTNSGSYAGSSGSSSVTFSGTTQFIGGSTPTGFRILNIGVGSTTTLGSNVSATNALSVSGTLDPGTGSGFSVSGAGTLSVASGGYLLVRATTFSGNYALTGTKTLSAGSTVNYTASGNQTVTNLTYSTLLVSGSGVKTLATNLPALTSSSATYGNINVSAATLDLSMFTANRGTTTAGGTFTVAAGATLRIGGTNTFPANYLTHTLAASSTVEYYGTNQIVATNAYGNLTLSSSGAATKTMPTNTLAIAGNLSSVTNIGGAALSFTAGAAINVNGSVFLGGGTTFNGGAFSHTVGGSWTNNGTFNSSTGGITFNGINALVTGAGTNNFYNFTNAAAGITTDTNTSLNVAGNFATSGTGTFTHAPGGAGTVTMSGAAKTITGSGITFNKLNIAGTNATSASFTVADNLTVNGALTNTSATLTLSGTNKTISGSGTMMFGALNIPGSITTTNNFSLTGNLTVGGSFTATAGTVTFAGSTILSGIANLFNTTVNGTLLRLGANSTLGMAGTFTLTAGTFDATNLIPNTVVYNGAGTQSISLATYDNLEIGGSSTKTTSGNLTVWGNLMIDPGATFNGGGFTNYLQGNWLNSGTFSAGTSTVEMNGLADATIAGTTTFNQLRVNKGNSSVLVNLTTNETVATLDMAVGMMNTGTNTLTITATRTNSGIVLGTITRKHSFSAGSSYAFESPNNTITFASLTSVTSVTVNASSAVVSDFPNGVSVNRQYTVSLASSGAYNATFRAHYEDAELNANTESLISLWQNTGSNWTISGKTANDATNNWVEQSSITNLTGRWTLSGANGTVRWNGSVSTAWETPGNWTIVSGSPSLPPSTNVVVELGTTNIVNQPTISSVAAVKSISFGSAQAITLTLGSGGSLQTSGNISGFWTNNATHTINIGAQTLTVGGSLTLGDGTIGHMINLNLSSGTATSLNDLTETGGANVTCSGSGTLIIYGNFYYSGGTFTPGNGTVKYTGSGAQIVAPVTYNHLTMDTPSGICTLYSNATVNGNLTLTNGGAFRCNANLTVAGSVFIRTNTILNPAPAVSLAVGGDWICGGTFTPDGSEVVFNGTGAQTIGACVFHDLDIDKPSGAATLAGNIGIESDVDIRNGTLDVSTYAINISASGSILTASAGTTLRTAGAFPTGFAGVMLDAASTVEYYGSASQMIAATTYGNLLVNNGASNPKTLSGAVSIAGDLLIGNNSILSASNNNLTLFGSWTNKGIFDAGTGLVLLGGTNKFLAGNTSFTNLTVSGSYLANNGSIAINGSVLISGGGSYTATNGTTTILSGNLNNSGALLNYATLTFSGTQAQTLALNAGFVNFGTVNFNGSVAPAIRSTAPSQHQNVNINNTAGIALDGGWSVFGAFNIAPGAIWSGNTGTYLFAGTVTNSGTMNGSGTLSFSPTNPTTLVLGTNFSSSGSVLFGGTQPIAISSTSLSLNSVEIANSHANSITPASNWTLAGDLQIDAGATFHAGTGLVHRIAGNLANDGILDGGTSLVIFNGTTLTAGAGSTVFYNLLVSSNLTLGADLSVALNFTNNGTFDDTGGNLYFTGSANSIIAGNTPATAIDSIVVAKNYSTNLVTLALNITNLTSLVISTGVFDTSAYTVSEDPVNLGSLSVNANSTLKLGGSGTFPTFTGDTSLNPGSTVEYSGGAQSISPVPTYANLKLSGTGNKTLNSIATINGNVDISGAAKFNLSYNKNSTSAAGSLSYAGVVQGQNNTYGSTSSSAANKTDTYFQGNGLLTVGSIVMDHFAIALSGTPTVKTPVAITITALDANNNIVTAYTNLVNMAETGDGTGGTISPTNSGYFSAGILASQTVTFSKAGAAVTLTVIGTNTPGSTIYTNVSDPFTVNPATPDLSWATPTNIVYGTALGTNQNNATSSLPGNYLYSPTNGTVLPAGTNTLSVSFTPSDSNYSNRTTIVSLVVTPAILGIVANNTNRFYGATNPIFTYTAIGFVNGDTTNLLGGAPSLTTGATTNSPAGSYIITNSIGTLSATNYIFSLTNSMLTVNQAGTSVSLSSSSQTNGYRGGVTFTASLPSTATGNVTFKTNNAALSTSNLVSGITQSLTITNLPRGTNLITAEYAGDANYLGSTNTLNQVVTNHPPVVTTWTLLRPAGSNLLIALSEMATNWTDADGDALSLTSLTVQSTNHVNLQVLNWITNQDGVSITNFANAYIGYTNAVGTNDQLSYTISDGYGGSTTGFINVNVDLQTLIGQQSGLNVGTNGNPKVTFYGVPGYTYVVQRSFDLSGWLDLLTNAIPFGTNNPVFKISDTNNTHAYYRLKWLP